MVEADRSDDFNDERSDDFDDEEHSHWLSVVSVRGWLCEVAFVESQPLRFAHAAL